MHIKQKVIKYLYVCIHRQQKTVSEYMATEDQHYSKVASTGVMAIGQIEEDKMSRVDRGSQLY